MVLFVTLFNLIIVYWKKLHKNEQLILKWFRYISLNSINIMNSDVAIFLNQITNINCTSIRRTI